MTQGRKEEIQGDGEMGDKTETINLVSFISSTSFRLLVAFVLDFFFASLRPCVLAFLSPLPVVWPRRISAV
jgi:hypothetical protein